MTDTIKAWHFVGATLRDGRPIPRNGAWLRHDGRIAICEGGLHASRRPWHALRYAPGSVLCYVECRGDIYEHDDKLVCRERRILTRADMTETLRFFARMQALSVVHIWPTLPPDVLLDYLMTGDAAIRAAARAAALGTAWDAAGAAALGTAWDAARAAAWAAAWGTARDAAREAAWEAAGREFDALIYEQFGVGA